MQSLQFPGPASRDLTSAPRPHKQFSSLTFPSFYSLKTPITAEAATLPTALIITLLPWPTRGIPFAPGEHPLFEGPEPSGSGAATGGSTSSWQN